MNPINIEEKFAQLDSRLSKIENQLNIKSQTKPADIWSQPAVVPKPQPIFKPAATSPQTSSGNWLGIVAIICFVLAAGFIIKLSIDSGWLTPERQIGLAALLGLSLIGAGFALLKSDREYASLLPGAGIIVLYITAFAAHRYYQLIPFELAIGFVSLISGLSILCYNAIKHDVYAITASIGAYVSPVLLGLNSGADFSLYYYLACSVAFTSISIWLQSRTLTLISAYLAILMSAFVGLELQQDKLVAVILIIHFMIFSFGTYLYSLQNNTPMNESEAQSFLPALLIFYAAEYYFLNRIQPELAPWISLFFAGFLLTLYFSAKRYFPDNLGSQSVVLAFATIVCFHSAYLELLPTKARSWLFVAIMLGVAFSPRNFSTPKQGSPYFIPILGVLAILANEYITMIFHLLGNPRLPLLAVSFAAIASIWAVIVTLGNTFTEEKKYGQALLSAAHLLAVLALYRIATDTGSLAVSASWLFYALFVMLFAFHRKDELMAKSALFVLGFAAGKALLYDASSAPTIVRILCLLLTGAVLYGCGLLMRRIDGWKNRA